MEDAVYVVEAANTCGLQAKKSFTSALTDLNDSAFQSGVSSAIAAPTLQVSPSHNGVLHTVSWLRAQQDFS